VAPDIQQLLINIKNNPLKIPKDTKISPQVEDVLRKMLIMDPVKRISWEELFNHEGKRRELLCNGSGAHDGGQDQEGLRRLYQGQ
jgi:serine/threonine protein kinase